MNNVNKTLYILLYGKAYVSKRGLFLNDPLAEAIWEKEGFPLKGKAKSKWLAFYMGIRSGVFDEWTKDRAAQMPNATVLHVGCGMDSRASRLSELENLWFDIDFPEVIEERKKYFEESGRYKMICGDARKPDFLSEIPDANEAIVVMEGVSMYLSPEETVSLLSALSEKFGKIALLMDCYSRFAAKISRIRNPINQVGVFTVYGVDDGKALEGGEFKLSGELEMTPSKYLNQLEGLERAIFKRYYAGGLSKKLYRLYEYKKS